MNLIKINSATIEVDDELGLPFDRLIDPEDIVSIRPYYETEGAEKEFSVILFKSGLFRQVVKGDIDQVEAQIRKKIAESRPTKGL